MEWSALEWTVRYGTGSVLSCTVLIIIIIIIMIIILILILIRYFPSMTSTTVTNVLSTNTNMDTVQSQYSIIQYSIYGDYIIIHVLLTFIDVPVLSP